SLCLAQDLPEMIRVKGGTFTMGREDGSNINDAAPVRRVTVSDFHMSKTPVTVAQWKHFAEKTGKKMPAEPKWGWEDTHPMVNITWNEAVEYCDWLSEQTGRIVRLPTEAEWEYAAGTCKSPEELRKGGWFQNDSLTSTRPVAQKSPNRFGLYDMAGNVWEWCRDWYAWYPANQTRNPIGSYTGNFRILRGGSWYNFAESCGIQLRQKYLPSVRFDYVGFRVVATE
ncbi:MAG: formylglycine-generating enzyme family protein, partial [Leadbetterella sp.]|nr:formylglycine-generating enzyme family protein [Leadbetterella sp.]